MKGRPVPGNGGIELAQVWVPLMPEASKMARGVENVAATAERRFGKASKVIGGHLAQGVDAGASKMRQALADVEKRTLAVEKAKQREADAQGRVNVAEKRYHELRNSSSAKESQRMKAYEDMTRLQRAAAASTATLTRETKALSVAQEANAAASAAAASAAKVPMAQRLSAQAAAAGVASGQQFTRGFSSMLKSGAALAGVGGFAATLKSVVTAGVDMEANLNRLQGVTGANSKEMALASATAQKLGSDTTIVGATAADAAAAMLELAKSGLTMNQALGAAPGTLRLAAAASIDAATAAEAQGNIINSFQLKAEDANHVADALANVANAAAGDVPDFMQGLQQAATVAHGFGISMDDTVATLGLFANAGIKGSDAGTSLKTMLTHLAAPSDQAGKAMDALGLNIRNAKGEFVGMRELFRQIGEASSRMRPDDFQENVATVFGTDAIRGAMIAGSQGIETLDRMKKSVIEVGGSTKMAAANMQGVPGVLEKISNSASGVGLTFYEMIKPILLSGGDKVVSMLQKAQDALDKIKSGKGAGGALAVIADGWKNISGAVKDIGPDLIKAAAALAKGVGSAVVTGWNALGLAFQVIEPPAKLLLQVLNSLPGGLSTAATLIGALYLKSKLAGPAMQGAAAATKAWGNAFSGWRSQADETHRTMTRITTATGETVYQQRGYITQIRDAYRSSATEAGNFRRTMGVASGAMTGLRIAGGGVMSMLGGPWGAAAVGLTVAMGAVAKSHADAAEAARRQKQAEDELKGTMTAGRLSEQTLKDMSKALEDSGAAKRAQSFGLNPNVLLQGATGDKAAREQLLTNLQNQLADVEKNKGKNDQFRESAKALEVLKAAGVNDQDLAKALSKEGFNWDIATKKLDEYNAAQKQAFQADKRNEGKNFQPVIASLDTLMNMLPDAAESAATMNQEMNHQALTATNAAESWKRENAVLNGTWQTTARGVEAFAALGAAITSVQSDKQVTVSIPDDKYIEFKRRLEELGNKVEKLPDGTVVVTANTDEATERWKAYLQKVASTPVQVPIELQVQNYDAALRAWVQRVQAGQIGPMPQAPVTPGRTIGGRATGGRVDGSGRITGPGSGTSDSILAQVLGGGMVRVSNEESINTARSTRANWPVIDAMNRGANLTPWFKQLPTFAEGGLLDYAESLVGQGYSQASRWDCSGTIARLVNRAVGGGGGGLMTTKNAAEWLAARGFVEGTGGPDDFSVGWYDHGPNPNDGHMAATLPGGINAEQGGKNGVFTLGAGAAGANDPQFDRHMYLPVDAMFPEGAGGSGGFGGSFGGSGGGGSAGGSGSGPTGAERRALRNAAQKVDDTAKSVELAQKRLDEINADPKSKPSARAAAQERLNKAEREHQDALDDQAAKQEEVNQKVADRGSRGSKGDRDGKSGGPDGQSFAKDMLSGALEAFGLDGSVFSNPMEWGIWKTGTAAANWVGGLLKNWGTNSGPSRLNPYGERAYAGDPMGSQHGRGAGSPGPGNQGDGGLGGFQLGDGGGMSGVGDTLMGALPSVADFLPSAATNVGGPIDASITVNGNVDSKTWGQVTAFNMDRTRTAGSGLKGAGGF
ncbi:phage tail tape measure protein [Mycolicibacterium sp. lyk4-40-TYG-92]|uniref:phage tail tape measure protein n=1 Tax=Mycolicibacterium sp. lyk4-40-TYG-92 TaxID=3040295 RepID=UPI00254FAF38|nr:phage tail tape measure protein [Mycolicibacterium sp. lyk4-40-TYG-92]